MLKYTMANGAVIEYRHPDDAYNVIIVNTISVGYDELRARLRETLVLASQDEMYGVEYIDEMVDNTDVEDEAITSGSSIEDKVEFVLSYTDGWSDYNQSYSEVILSIIEESDGIPELRDFEAWLLNGGDLLFRLLRNDETLPHWRSAEAE